MSDHREDRILVVGAGSWGTAFANYLTRRFAWVRCWAREAEVRSAMKSEHRNPVFLPDISLSSRLIPVSDLSSEVLQADTVVWAIPSKYTRSMFESIPRTHIMGKPVVNLSKGMEPESFKRISEVAVDVWGEEVMEQWLTLSGPSFALELARQHPTAVVLGGMNSEILSRTQHHFSSEVLRIYRSTDLVGVEIAGSLKNIIAIASGIVHGLGYAYNTTASLVTRGAAEISRLGGRLGARQGTFLGLAGIGDLMLTSFSSLSRNFRLGQRIARGESLEEVEESTPMVAEGVETARAVKGLADRLNIDMPITSQVFDILFSGKSPRAAIRDLMERDLKAEWPTS